LWEVHGKKEKWNDLNSKDSHFKKVRIDTCGLQY
jgi:hypothetical protein